MYSMFPLAGGLLQLATPELPLSVVGFSLGIMMVYINFQNKRISQDSLTGVNNRHSLNLYIDQILKDKSSVRKSIYFLLMDIDGFKSINDNFGHVEGDNAIITVADVLTNLCERHQDFLARYGGDEFAIVSVRKSKREVEALKKDICAALDEVNRRDGNPYKLAVSIGSSEFFIDGYEQDEIISIADRQLYFVKSQKKKQINNKTN